MNVHEIKEIYPHALIRNEANHDVEFFNYFDGFQHAWIQKDKLKESEILLLEKIMFEKNNQSTWYQFLIKQEKPQFDKRKKIQIIHFEIDHIKEKQAWIEAFSSFFDQVEDAFFLNQSYGILIKNDQAINQEKLAAFIDLLDDDFSIKTHLYLGMITNTEQVYDIFQEEKMLIRSQTSPKKISNFKDLYLAYYFDPIIKESPILKNLKSQIKQSASEKLIRTLWQEQGNISSSSQKLHLHRNTLLYRINKINEEVNLNLRNIEDLLLAYLLTF